MSATDGVFNFTNLVVRQEPDTRRNYTVKFINFQNYGNDIKGITEPWVVPVYSGPCAMGENYGTDMSCSSCEEGEYLYEL